MMGDLASRLDPCVNWFKLLVRTKGRILWLFPALLLAGCVLAVAYGSPLSGFVDRFNQRRLNAPLLAEARGLNL